MDVSVIIINYNTRQMTAECIDSVFEKTKGVKFEIILVDNASTDGSKEFFEQDRRITYIYNNENLGFGRANNIGIKVAKGRNILFLNSDTKLIEDSISIMSHFMQKKNVSILGVKLIDKQGVMMHSYSPFLPSILWEFLVNFYPFAVLVMVYYKIVIFLNGYKKVGYITGADLMIDAKLLCEFGNYDEDFFMYFEEAELQHRLKRVGVTPYFYNGTSIIHLEGKSCNIKKHKEIMYYNSRNIYYSKYYSSTYHSIANNILIILLYINKSFWSLFKNSHMVDLLSFRIEMYRAKI